MLLIVPGLGEEGAKWIQDLYASRQLADNVLFCSCGSGWCGRVPLFCVMFDLEGVLPWRNLN